MGDAPDSGAVGIHDVGLVVPAAVARERDPAPVGRPHRVVVVSRVVREVHEAAPVPVHDKEVGAPLRPPREEDFATVWGGDRLVVPGEIGGQTLGLGNPRTETEQLGGVELHGEGDRAVPRRAGTGHGRREEDEGREGREEGLAHADTVAGAANPSLIA